jgi:hypothetical protein
MILLSWTIRVAIPVTDPATLDAEQTYSPRSGPVMRLILEK